MLKIGIYTSLLASERGHEHNVSGHIQIPVRTIQLLLNAGHEVHVITNRFADDRTLPAVLPPDLPLHLVEDGRRRPKRLRGERLPKGVRPVALLRQILQMRRIVRQERFDVLHIFGLARSAVLGGILKSMGVRCPIVVTVVGGNLPPRPTRFMRAMIRRLDCVMSGTEFAANQYRAIGVRVELVRHGIMRNLNAELQGRVTATPHRVLFWRDPNEMNGADVCVAAFDQLAPQFPEISFDLAIRPTRSEVPGIPELAARHPNVHVHRFPYSGDISLARLVAESLLIVLPFRRLSMDPQLAIAESLAAGVPVITTDVRSNCELVKSGMNGLIVPAGKVEPLATAIRGTLHDRAYLERMRAETAPDFHHHWNWDHYVNLIESVYRSLTYSQLIQSS